VRAWTAIYTHRRLQTEAAEREAHLTLQLQRLHQQARVVPDRDLCRACMLSSLLARLIWVSWVFQWGASSTKRP
jgi:hypothetical protein